MAEQKAAEAKKKGFFSRRKNEPAPAPPKASLPPVRPSVAPNTAAAAPAVEPRISLESMPEVEKRIDRMRATQRRASLMERYENKYGEKLDVPAVFVPVEQEKPEAPAPVAPEPPAVEAAPAGQPAAAKAPATEPVAATAAEKPSTPSLPPNDVKLPEAKPAAVAAKPAAPAAPVKPAAPAAKPAVASTQKPAPAPEPSKPSPINGKSFWKYLWPYWRLPLRDLAKYYTPDKKGNIMAAMIADMPVWILLALPRIGLCPIGFALDHLKKRKAKQANGEKTEAAVATN